MDQIPCCYILEPFVSDCNNDAGQLRAINKLFIHSDCLYFSIAHPVTFSAFFFLSCKHRVWFNTAVSERLKDLTGLYLLHFVERYVRLCCPYLTSLKKTDWSAFIAPWMAPSDVCVNATLLQGVPVCVGVNVIRWCLFFLFRASD